jgi:hypothetical protein
MLRAASTGSENATRILAEVPANLAEGGVAEAGVVVSTLGKADAKPG